MEKVTAEARDSGPIISTVQSSGEWFHTCLILCFFMSYAKRAQILEMVLPIFSLALHTSIGTIKTTPPPDTDMPTRQTDLGSPSWRLPSQVTVDLVKLTKLPSQEC